MRSRGRARAGLALATALIGLTVSSQPASAAATRAEYVAQADPICHTEQAQQKASFKRYTKALGQYLKNHPNPDPNRPSKTVLHLVSHHYSRVLESERSANSQLAAIVPAPGDEGLIGQWLQLRVDSADFLDRGIRAERRLKVKHFVRLYLKSIRRSLQAELAVRDFGFQYCSQAPPDV